MVATSFAELGQQIDTLTAEKANLEEMVSDLAMRLDTVGWVPGNGWDEDAGLTLEALQHVSKTLTDMVAQNPLMKRAVQLRHGYVFGRGMLFSDVKPRHQKIMDKPFNKNCLFTMMAWEELMATRMTDGNLFVLRKTRDEEYYRIPIDQITGVVTDPESKERVWYIQRTYTEYQIDGKSKQRVVWYPTYENSNRKHPTSIADKPVSKDAVMHFMPFNRQVGFTFGVPDGYAAITWAIAYSEYLKNNSKLVKAYATIAFKASTKTQNGANNIAAQIAQPGVAGTATMGLGQDLLPMPRAGSDVSFENGRPLASMVAASLGVSVVALLSDPGAAGSSYGSAQTLDAPTIIVMTSIQEAWKDFYTSLFGHVSGDPITVEFPSIENDQVYRQIQSLAQAYATGAISQREYRDAVLDLLDIRNPQEALPVPDNFNNAHLTPEEQAKQAQAQAAAKATDPTARQGNSGATGGDKGETNNDGRTDTLTTGSNG